jgi:predicted nucleotidyltransferase
VAGAHEVPREAQAAVDRFVAAVREVFGQDLLSVVLYGSAASGEYVPGRSDINLALVLESITLDALARCRPHLATWRKDGIALPLLLTPEDIRRSADIFPVEFLDICEHHVLIHGSDFFADLSIDPRHLRFQVEHELKAKLLALRQAYLAGLDRTRTDALVEDLFATSMPAVVALGRNLLRVAGHRPPARKAETLAALERAFGLSLPTLSDLVGRRARGQSLMAGEAVPRFSRYLSELDALARVVDRLGDPEALRGRGEGRSGQPT